MEKLADILTNYLLKSNIIIQEKRPIYKYGFQVGIEVCLNTVISMIIAICLDMILETILFFCIFAMLRSYAGGLHLNTYLACLICSSGSLFILLLIVKFLNVGRTISCLIILSSIIVIKIWAPIEDINRPLDLQDKQKFKRKLGYSILLIIALSAIFYVFHFERLLFMIAVTVLFMDLILVLGKIKYKMVIHRITISE